MKAQSIPDQSVIRLAKFLPQSYQVSVEGIVGGVYDPLGDMEQEGDLPLPDPIVVSEAATRQAANGWDDLADYIDADDIISGKVMSIGAPIVIVNADGSVETLFLVHTQGELSPEEETALKDYINGQCSDGWGEGFAQFPIELEDRDVYVSPWVFQNKVMLSKF